MSSEKGADTGTHYHYHFYGAGNAPSAQPGASSGAPHGGPQGIVPEFTGQQGFPPPPPFGPFGPYPFAGAHQAGAQAPGGGQPGASDPAGFNFHRHPGADSLVKGLLVGAAAAYLLTNERAQKAIMRTAVQAWAVVQGGIEELKERLHDAEAEVAASAAEAHAEPTPDATRD